MFFAEYSTSYPKSLARTLPEAVHNIHPPATNVVDISNTLLKCSRKFSSQDAISWQIKGPARNPPELCHDVICRCHFHPCMRHALSAQEPQPHVSQPIPTFPPSTGFLLLQSSLESWIVSHFPSFASNAARIRTLAIARWWVQL